MLGLDKPDPKEALVPDPIPPQLAATDDTLDETALLLGVMDDEPDLETLDDDERVLVEEARERAGAWTVTDDGAAEWALRELAMANEDIARLTAQGQEWTDRIVQWLDSETKPYRRKAAYMVERLEAYALRLRQAGGPATLNLPSGTLKTTRSEPSAKVEDDEKVATHVVAMLEVELAMPHGLEDAPPTPWADKAREHGIGPDDVARWSAKAYVAPLRKLVTIGEREVGQQAHVTLGGCGHTLTVACAGLDDPTLPSVAEFVECWACEPDPIDGAKRWPVQHLEVVPVVELVVLGPDGQPVPGTIVDPGGLSPKVTPRA